MQRFAQFVVLTLLCSMPGMAMAAAQKQVQVGTFTINTPNTYGTGFFATLNAISAQPICFGAISWIVDGVSRSFPVGSGASFCTLPLTNPPYPNQILVIGCDPNTPTCFNQCVSDYGSAAACE